MQWHDDYNIGVLNIDQQHRKLINTLNRLQDSLTTIYVDNQMATTLKFIVSYTKHHFSEEEEFMESIGYPEIDLHKTQHKDLINEVRAILIKLKNKQKVNANELIEFLLKWLNDHIINEDLKIKAYIQKLENKGKPKVKPFSYKLLKEKLLNKLKDLANIYHKELITLEEYTDKKNYLINDFSSFQNIESKTALDRFIIFLEELRNEDLINTEEAGLFKKELYANLNLNLILQKIQGNVEKMEYIKILMDRGLLTTENFQEYKNKLLDNID